MNKIKGDFVECRVYRGGNAIIAAKIFEINRVNNKVILFDTFLGMPKPEPVDFKMMHNLSLMGKYLKAKRKDHTDWAYASIEEVKLNFKRLNLLTENIKFVKVAVEETLVRRTNIPDRISILRLDTDFYSSTKKELEKLYEKLIPGGILVIDDYGTFNGSKKACDEYFGNHVPPPFFSLIDSGARVATKI